VQVSVLKKRESCSMRYEAVTNLMAVVTVSHELFLYANLVAK
jgi:hypothetical protein